MALTTNIKGNIENYFPAAFSVDCVVFGLDGNQLKILVIERAEEPFKDFMALPGNLVKNDEDLDEAADRVLKELTSLDHIYLEQVHTFGHVNRHPKGRVITIAYYALIPVHLYELKPLSTFAKSAQWISVNHLKELAFDHKEILDACYKRLQNKVLHEPIGFNLLPDKFTLSQLQTLYEAILGMELDKRNFRKKIVGMNLLIDLDQQQQNVSHRPAKLYSFDKDRYEALIEKGFSFEL